MADIEPRRSSRPSRAARERRAFQLVVAGGALGTFGVVGLVLALFTSFGAGLPILALMLSAVCIVLMRRTVS